MTMPTQTLSTSSLSPEVASAAEANLSYFRFDGKSYHLIGTAKLVTDNQQNQKIVPTPK